MHPLLIEGLSDAVGFVGRGLQPTRRWRAARRK
jgi:hypothetical protein